MDRLDCAINRIAADHPVQYFTGVVIIPSLVIGAVMYLTFLLLGLINLSLVDYLNACAPVAIPFSIVAIQRISQAKKIRSVEWTVSRTIKRS